MQIFPHIQSPVGLWQLAFTLWLMRNLSETLMCLIEETGDRALMNVRAGGAGGCQRTLFSPKFWATQIFGAAIEILAKPIFTKVSMFRFVFLFL